MSILFRDQTTHMYTHIYKQYQKKPPPNKKSNFSSWFKDYFWGENAHNFYFFSLHGNVISCPGQINLNIVVNRMPSNWLLRLAEAMVAPGQPPVLKMNEYQNNYALWYLLISHGKYLDKLITCFKQTCNERVISKGHTEAAIKKQSEKERNNGRRAQWVNLNGRRV